MSDPSPPKRPRLGADEHACVFPLVLGSGFIPWYDLEALQLVSKQWRADILEVRGSLPDWDRIVKLIDEMNGFNCCENCDKHFKYACTCGKSNDPHSACTCLGENHEPTYCCTSRYSKRMRSPDDFGRTHPRNHHGFALLPSFDKAMKLLAFHKRCVQNLLGFYPEDLSTPTSGYYAKGYESWDENFFGLEELMEYNPKAYFLLSRVAELKVAKSDLSSPPYHFKSAFAGVTCAPLQGSSFNDCMMYSMIDIITTPLPRTSDQMIDCPAMGSWSVSQVRQLEETLRGILTTRDKTADAVLGSKIADSIDVYNKARETTLPMLDSIFPLVWMPMFDQ